MAETLERATIAARAEENRRLLDGTTDPVKQIIADADIVFGVWPDPTQPHGVGMHVIKGRRRLAAIAVAEHEAIAGGMTSETLNWNAIPCASEEQAIAAQWILGEPG